ncbi:MAG: alkene reductase [Nevskia sp.]|nr:alkene reductase [Nevskia sp.]
MPDSTTATRQDCSDLFKPVRLGASMLANRIVMAPLTRSRAGDDGVPTALMAEYYGQRASAGLIIAEATNISPQARGYAFTPGIYDGAQIEGWKKVTHAVHAHGGTIFLQLWHTGRISHPSLQPGGALPVAPSAVCAKGNAYTAAGYQPLVTPRALETAEITGIVEQYRRAAHNAMAAGFDGVEVHAANGYLIEQFLRDSCNHRTDAYGGSREHRARLLLEVTAAVAGACGAQRVGIRLSPVSPANDLGQDSDPAATYLHVVKHLSDYGLAYLHVIEGVTQGSREVPGAFDLQLLRRAFKGLYMANNGYSRELALQARRRGLADLIAFGPPLHRQPGPGRAPAPGRSAQPARSQHLFRRRGQRLHRLPAAARGGSQPADRALRGGSPERFRISFSGTPQRQW